MKKIIKDFIVCHEGVINKIFHLVGFVLVGYGLWKLDIYFYILGVITQEGGHFYQYIKTKDYKYSPLNCLKPQAIIAYPLFALGLIYIILNN